MDERISVRLDCMLKEEIENIDNSPKTLRNFGITIGGVMLLIGLWGMYSSGGWGIWLAGGGALLIAFAFIASAFLKPLNLIWMTLAIIMGWFMTRFILGALYYLVLTPIGLFLRISGKDLLHAKANPAAATYWKKREYAIKQPSDYEKQF